MSKKVFLVTVPEFVQRDRTLLISATSEDEALEFVQNNYDEIPWSEPDEEFEVTESSWEADPDCASVERYNGDPNDPNVIEAK